MARYKIEVTVSDTNINAAKKRLAGAWKGLEDESSIRVSKIEDNPSRADRLSDAEARCSDAKGAVEELIQEMQDWKDGMPENLQESEKANQVQEAIDNLDSLRDRLEEAEGEFGSIEFPGMMG